MDKRYNFAKKITVYFLSFIVIIFALVEAQKFLAPLFLAALLTYLLFPIGNYLEKHGVPRILANLICVIFGIAVIVGVVIFFLEQFSIFTDDLPKMRNQAGENLRSFEKWISSIFEVPQENVNQWLNEGIAAFTNSEDTFIKAFETTTSTLVRIGLMPVYIFFMLYYRNKFYDFILQMAPDKEEERTEKILNEVNHVAINYITGVFIVVLIISVLNSIGLIIIGLDYPILLGVTAALFNFIPYFGTLIGAIIPLLYSLLAMDSLNYALLVVIFFLIIQFIENNILTPNITGGSVRMNPFMTILSLILGSMVWGVVGMFIIVPFMAMFKIFCENITFLKPIGFLLSNRGTKEYAITWKKIKQIFAK
jgi:predicted PurR-regulated permease PerM